MTNWIQNINIDKGALSEQLGIPEEQNIPITLLRKIVKSKPNRTIKNPCKTGNKEIYVTEKMKHQANLAINFKNMKKSKN